MLLHKFDLSSVRHLLIDRCPDVPSMKWITSGRSNVTVIYCKNIFCLRFLMTILTCSSKDSIYKTGQPMGLIILGDNQ